MEKLARCAIAAPFSFSITAKVALFHGDSPLVGEEHSLSKYGTASFSNSLRPRGASSFSLDLAMIIAYPPWKMPK